MEERKKQFFKKYPNALVGGHIDKIVARNAHKLEALKKAKDGFKHPRHSFMDKNGIFHQSKGAANREAASNKRIVEKKPRGVAKQYLDSFKKEKYD